MKKRFAKQINSAGQITETGLAYLKPFLKTLKKIALAASFTER